MNPLEAVIRVLIEQTIRKEDPFDLDYDNLSAIHNTIKELNVPAIIGDPTPFSSDNDSEFIKIRKTVLPGTVEELTEKLFWEIVEERRKTDPYRSEKLLYKEYLRMDEGDPRFQDLEDLMYTDEKMLDFFENCREGPNPYLVEC